MNPSQVSFKGTREGIVITLGEGDWHDVLNEVTAQLGRPSAQSFFRGARVILETGNRAIDVIKLEELIALLSQHNMTLRSVSGGTRAQQILEQVRATIPPVKEMPVAEEVMAPQPLSPAPLNGDHALLIHRTIRSGQRSRYAGTIVVIGDVNPGAEIVADGNIIVWGKLRGVVHAGASGNENAIVGALILEPTQLRISSYIARAPDERHSSRNSFPEVARIRDGQIIVEPWINNS